MYADAVCGCGKKFNGYCSASEVRHPSEVRHLHFMTILKSFYCPVMAYMYTLPLVMNFTGVTKFTGRPVEF